VLLSKLGNYEEALTLHEKTLQIYKAVLGTDHPRTALTFDNMAQVLEGLGEYEKARLLYEQALKIRDKVLGKEHIDTANSLNGLASVLVKLSYYDEAKPLYERALKIRKLVLGSEHPSTATCLANLAWLLSNIGNYEEAMPFCEQAIQIKKKILGNEHPSTIAKIDDLSMLHINCGEPGKAWELSKQSIIMSETNLKKLLWSLSEHERLLYAAKKRAVLDFLLSLAENETSCNAREFSYETLIHWKGWVSRSLFQSKDQLRRQLTPEAKNLREQLKQIQSKLSKALYTQNIKDKKIHDARLSKLREQRTRIELELLHHLGRLEEEDRLSIEDLRSALPKNSAIIDFYIHSWHEPAVFEEQQLVQRDRWSPPHLSAWILRNDGELKHIDLGPANPLQRAVKSFLESLAETRGIILEEETSLTQKTNNTLRSLLWDPLASHIRGADKIFISPDTFLGTLPFEVIQREDKSYLIEHYAFVYLQDMASLVRITKRKEESSIEIPRLLVVGDVDYKKRKDFDGQEAEEHYSNLLAQRGSFSSYWASLPETGYEAEVILDMYKDAYEHNDIGMMLKGAEATEERIKTELPKFCIIHLATHGFFQPEGLPSMWEQAQNKSGVAMEMRPEAKRLTGMLPDFLSGLVLAGANHPPQEERDDGLLTAEELSWLDLSEVDLVVLSACETGLGTPRGGEGMMGLRRSLRQAGVKTVISSLWSVKDESTRELMQNFYFRLWIFKERKREALRGAQLEMLKKNRIENTGRGLPSTWGAFVLDGDWREADNEIKFQTSANQ